MSTGYREPHDRLLALRAKARGPKAQALHEFAEPTTHELPGARFQPQDLRATGRPRTTSA